MQRWEGSEDQGVLFDAKGRRVYLRAEEVLRLLTAARDCDPSTNAFCRLLAFTGCRLSEALELTVDRLDFETGSVVFRTLKRRKLVYRAVPVPLELLRQLSSLSEDGRLWGWCRQTAWRRVRAVMAAAGIEGPHATPKGLRHGFGIANAEQNVPPGLTQRWMGHARLETTTIYQHAVGAEERSFAKRLWRGLADGGG